MARCSADGAAEADVAQGVDSLQSGVGLAELDLELGQAELDGGGGDLAGGDRLLVLGDGDPQVLGGAAGLVDLAVEQVEGPFEVARLLALRDLGEQVGDDRLGLLGVAGLDHRPGGPDLVLGIEVAQPHGVLEVLAAQALFLRQDQRHAVAGLRLGDLGQLGRGGLQVGQGAGAELGLERRRRRAGSPSPRTAAADTPDFSRSIAPWNRCPSPW